MKRSQAPLPKDQILKLLNSPEERWPEAEKTLLEQGTAAALVAFELSDNPFAASFLPKAAKKSAVRAALEDRLSKSRDALTSRLKDPSPKRRKQAARLTGALANPLDIPALIAALEGETTRFVRPSLILALGNMRGEPAALDFLRNYITEPPAKPEEEKHALEEQRSLAAALSRIDPAEIPAFAGLDEHVRVELRGVLASSILYEGGKLGMEMLERGEGVELFCSDMRRLDAIRSWREALLPLGQAPFDAGAVAALIERVELHKKLTRWHGVSVDFPIRFEVRGVSHQERSAFIEKCAPLFAGLGFVSAPGAYAAELRMEPSKGGARVYVKLSRANDERFSYRKKALPASIYPADAAALVRFAFAKDRPGRVLDPCCGSGTLLIEYGKFAPARLMGADISQNAIGAARENAAAANMEIQLLRKDLKDLIVGEPFDALVANLPFGLRAGTHGDNKTLYPALLDSIPRWLRPGGVAALYTADANLLMREIRKRRFLSVKQEARVEMGGLYAHIIVASLTR